MGLLIDLDNGADLGKRRDGNKDLAFRTVRLTLIP